MFNAKKILIFLFLIFLIFIIFISFLSNQTKYFNGYKKIKVKIKNKIYTLFLVDTEEKKTKGLSNIPSIRNNQGMIFVFDQADYYSFWMKNMNFSLDFIFLKGNKIVDYKQNVLPNSYSKTYTSKIPSDKIIELKAEEINKLKIKIGDEVKFL